MNEEYSYVTAAKSFIRKAFGNEGKRLPFHNVRYVEGVADMAKEST